MVESIGDEKDESVVKEAFREMKLIAEKYATNKCTRSDLKEMRDDVIKKHAQPPSRKRVSSKKADAMDSSKKLQTATGAASSNGDSTNPPTSLNTTSLTQPRLQRLKSTSMLIEDPDDSSSESPMPEPGESLLLATM